MRILKDSHKRSLRNHHWVWGLLDFHWYNLGTPPSPRISEIWLSPSSNDCLNLNPTPSHYIKPQGLIYRILSSWLLVFCKMWMTLAMGNTGQSQYEDWTLLLSPWEDWQNIFPPKPPPPVMNSPYHFESGNNTIRGSDIQHILNVLGQWNWNNNIWHMLIEIVLLLMKIYCSN